MEEAATGSIVQAPSISTVPQGEAEAAPEASPSISFTLLRGIAYPLQWILLKQSCHTAGKLLPQQPEAMEAMALPLPPAREPEAKVGRRQEGISPTLTEAREATAPLTAAVPAHRPFPPREGQEERQRQR